MTQKMLLEARHELKHEITSFRLEMDSRFERVDAAILTLRAEVHSEIADVRSEIADVRSEIADARSEITELRADIVVVRSDIEKVLAAVHRIGLLVEEQNARNKYVLDGYTSLSDRIDKIEKGDKDL